MLYTAHDPQYLLLKGNFVWWIAGGTVEPGKGTVENMKAVPGIT